MVGFTMAPTVAPLVVSIVAPLLTLWWALL